MQFPRDVDRMCVTAMSSCPRSLSSHLQDSPSTQHSDPGLDLHSWYPDDAHNRIRQRDHQSRSQRRRCAQKRYTSGAQAGHQPLSLHGLLVICRHTRLRRLRRTAKSSVQPHHLRLVRSRTECNFCFVVIDLSAVVAFRLQLELECFQADLMGHFVLILIAVKVGLWGRLFTSSLEGAREKIIVRLSILAYHIIMSRCLG